MVCSLVLMLGACLPSGQHRSRVYEGALQGCASAIVVRLRDRVYLAYDAETGCLHRGWVGSLEVEELSSDSSECSRQMVMAPARIIGSVFARGPQYWSLRQEAGGSLEARSLKIRIQPDEAGIVLSYELAVSNQRVQVEEHTALLSASEKDDLWSAWTGQSEDRWPEELAKLEVLHRGFTFTGSFEGESCSLLWMRNVHSVTSTKGLDESRAPEQLSVDRREWEPIWCKVAGPRAVILQTVDPTVEPEVADGE